MSIGYINSVLLNNTILIIFLRLTSQSEYQLKESATCATCAVTLFSGEYNVFSEMCIA
jgi:hypothetical protein